VAEVLEKNLGLDPQPKAGSIAVTKDNGEAVATAKMQDADVKNGVLKFTTEERFLPLPFPLLTLLRISLPSGFNTLIPITVFISVPYLGFDLSEKVNSENSVTAARS